MSVTNTGTSKKRALFESSIVRRAVVDSLKKLDPRVQAKNPVMFVVQVGSVVTTLLLILPHGSTHFAFNLQITLWLWFTVLFANFAEAMAEGRGKAQADALRKAKSETTAYKLKPNGEGEEVASSHLRVDDRVRVVAGQMIPGDGEVMVVRITANPGETFLDRMIALVEGAERQKTPNEIALNILLAGLTIIF